MALAAASRQRLDALANEERRTKRLRLLLVGVIGLLIIALLAGGLWVQRQNAAQQQQIAEPIYFCSVTYRAIK